MQGQLGQEGLEQPDWARKQRLAWRQQDWWLGPVVARGSQRLPISPGFWAFYFFFST